jgi:hypothetical protein
MTVLTLTLPLARTSPLHLTRRDLVTDPGDDLTLQVAIIADDTPEAAPVALDAAMLQMLLWHGPYSWASDYSHYPITLARDAASIVTGTITDAADGRASLTVPTDVDRCWPRRMGYTLRLTLGGAKTTLGWGMLNMPRVHA